MKLVGRRLRLLSKTNPLSLALFARSHTSAVGARNISYSHECMGRRCVSRAELRGAGKNVYPPTVVGFTTQTSKDSQVFNILCWCRIATVTYVLTAPPENLTTIIHRG